MTDDGRTRPTPTSRVWSRKKVVADNLYGDDLADVLQHDRDASAWWVLSREAGLHLHELTRALDLDAMAIDDLTADDRRAKFEQLKQNRLVVTSALSLRTEDVALDATPISVVVSERALVCLAEPAPKGFHPAALLTDRNEDILTGGVETGLRVLVAAVVSSYEDVVDWLEGASDDLADALFEERPLNKSEQLHAFKLRTMLSQLRRLTEPMRTVTRELADSFADANGHVSREWAGLTERQTRVAHAADALRDALASVFETSLGLADLRMNQVMKKLSGWAGIIAVPTLVTGFVGMNVDFPLDGTVPGFWFYLAVMVVSAAILFIVFRRKDWL